MKIGVELKIDVTKIDKDRIFIGKKGKYLTMTAFIDLDNETEFGDNGMITHKRLNDDEKKPPILGNVKVYWREKEENQPVNNSAPQQAEPQQMAPQNFDQFDDIPF